MKRENPFWDPAIEVLNQLARDPVAPVDELRELQRQIESAISLLERGDLVPMTDQERREHASRFGPCAFVIGDFVIRRR